MSRGGLDPFTVKMQEAIREYANHKAKADQFKKVADSLNLEIKQQFKDHNITEFVVDDMVATVTYAPREDFNELQAIEILRKDLPEEQFNQLVKTREYLDQDAFEKAVYNKQIDAAILSPAVTPKEPVATLRLGKVKK